MRRQRYMRISSAQNVCIFCAYRLSGAGHSSQPYISSISSHRGLNTTSSSKQVAEAASVETTSNGAGGASPPNSIISPNRDNGISTLSASEQAERARLRGLREDREQQQALAAEQRLKQSEKAREAKQLKDKEALQAARRAILDRQQRESQDTGPPRTNFMHGEVKTRKIVQRSAAQHHVEGPRIVKLFKHGSSGSKSGAYEGLVRYREDAPTLRSGKAVTKEASKVSEPVEGQRSRLRFHDGASRPTSSFSMDGTANHREAKESQRKLKPEVKLERIAMPSFGANDSSMPKDEGWGIKDNRSRLDPIDSAEENEADARARHVQRARLLGINYVLPASRNGPLTKGQREDTALPPQPQDDVNAGVRSIQLKEQDGRESHDLGQLNNAVEETITLSDSFRRRSLPSRAVETNARTMKEKSGPSSSSHELTGVKSESARRSTEQLAATGEVEILSRLNAEVAQVQQEEAISGRSVEAPVRSHSQNARLEVPNVPTEVRPPPGDTIAYRAWLQAELARFNDPQVVKDLHAVTGSADNVTHSSGLSFDDDTMPSATDANPSNATRTDVEQSNHVQDRLDEDLARQPRSTNDSAVQESGNTDLGPRDRQHGTRVLKLDPVQSPRPNSHSKFQQRSDPKEIPDPFSASNAEEKEHVATPWGGRDHRVSSSRAEEAVTGVGAETGGPQQKVQHPGLEGRVASASPRYPTASVSSSLAARTAAQLPPQHFSATGQQSFKSSEDLPWDHLLDESHSLSDNARLVTFEKQDLATKEHKNRTTQRLRSREDHSSWGEPSKRAERPGIEERRFDAVEMRADSASKPEISTNRPFDPKPRDQASTPQGASEGIVRSVPSQPSRSHQLVPSEDSMRHSASTNNTASVSSWPLLRRKSAPETKQSSAPSHQTFGQDHDLDTDWVNRRFEEHRRRRETHAISSVPSAQTVDHSHYSPRVPGQSPASERICARCGEKGHSARQCVGVICNRCGEKGHMPYECRNPPKTVRRVQIDSPDGNERPSNERNESTRLATNERYQSRAIAEREPVRRNDDRSTPAHVQNSQDDMRSMLLEKQPLPANDTLDEAELRRRERRASKWAEAEADEKAQHSKSSHRGRGVEDDDDEGGAARDEKNARKAARKRDREQERQEAAQLALEQGPTVRLPHFVSVATLAQTLGVRYEHFVKRLERLGYHDIFPGMVLNSEVSGMIAMEYNVEPIFDSAEDEAEERDLKALPLPESKEYLPSRPPVVTIMGHVDHGKTTILDFLRKSSVAAGEAGGITQHIGAFSVPLAASGKAITFLDTPGHAAFLSMRQRGANVTDIVILVVAADDSVKPQTLEAIKHAKSAGVPIIVAINKVDKEEADVQRVKQDLARHEIDIEDYGGDTQVVEVSGKTGQGMDSLEEAIISLSEILDHRAETQGAVEGWVLEATTKKSGRVATVLVRRGILRPGTIIVAGRTWARVRTLKNEGGQLVNEVGPGMPVEVDGWRDQPSAGDEVLQAPSEQKANDAVDYRTEMMEREKTAQDTDAINQARRSEQQRKRAEALAAWSTEEPDTFEKAEEDSSTNGGGQILVPFIIKADVSGSAEAVTDYIQSIASPLIAPQILASEVGQVHESDIDRAAAANGYIIAFNLPLDENMKGMAAHAGVEILENNIIYRVQEDVKALFEAKLPAIVTQKVIGEAEIAASFDIGVGGRKTMKIAGCKIRNGTVNRGSRVRLVRNGEKVYDGVLASLKNVKKDVQEMRKGTECGMSFDDWAAFEIGDQIQTYIEISEKRKL